MTAALTPPDSWQRCSRSATAGAAEEQRRRRGFSLWTYDLTLQDYRPSEPTCVGASDLRSNTALISEVVLSRKSKKYNKRLLLFTCFTEVESLALAFRVASTQWWIVGATTILLVLALCWALLAQSGPPSNVRLIARGAGITVEGGTGSPDFVPVRTQVAFHAEIVDGAVIGNFECLALAPAAGSGPLSGEFNTNVMYVTGPVQSVTIDGDTIRMSGGSDCTGIGAGSNVPWSAVIKKGGPGATLVLTAGTTQQVFREILLDGLFEIMGQPTAGQQAGVLSPQFLRPRSLPVAR